ncbi:MAG: hypothetical protein UIG59_07745, partial [Acutalibacteraceae bacterium]|nr:hypothetical protein [Acutalibacteraceae bacterium]
LLVNEFGGKLGSGDALHGIGTDIVHTNSSIFKVKKYLYYILLHKIIYVKKKVNKIFTKFIEPTGAEL